MTVTYRFVKGKYVLHKDGVYFAIKPEQVDQLIELLNQIKQKRDTGQQEQDNDVGD